METSFQATPDIAVIPSYFPIPKMGFLAVNSFVIKAKEPVLVDTGMGIESEEFMKALESIIDLQDLRWIWLTHDDADHTGNIKKVLDAAPQAKVAANSLATLRMSTDWPVPMDRVHWLNSGDSIYAGDRKLTAVRPPMFDNPTTIGIFDDKSQAFFSADFFGAIVPEPVRDADDISDTDLAQGMVGWASADSPWVHMTETGMFTKALDTISMMDPKLIFSAHLPPATGKALDFLELLSTVPASPPFITPDQKFLTQLLVEMKQDK